MKTLENPFKFGGVVNTPFFTNRTKEIDQLNAVLNSANHVTIISPRRFGKTSLVYKVISNLNRPIIDLNLQMITSVDDLAKKLLKRIFSTYPFEKVKSLVKEFRFIPILSLNPITNETDIQFNYIAESEKNLEDVLNLLNQLAESDRKPIIVLDEFQEVIQINKNLPKYLRSIMQHHTNMNYLFLGSQESLIRDMFTKKKSPFYHFGMIMNLNKIPRNEFQFYIEERLLSMTSKADIFADEILNITDAHPYYTQQLAFAVWNELYQQTDESDVLSSAIDSIIQMHDLDYERQWIGFNQTDKKVLVGLAESKDSPLSDKFSKTYQTGASSTTYSSLKRLLSSGVVIKLDKGYEIDDPFFKKWITINRN